MKIKGFYSQYTDEPNLMFNFCHASGAERSFVYSGILDVGINQDYTTFAIKHHSTRILIEGVNLYELYKDVCRCLATDIKENEVAENEKKEKSAITSIKYEDAECPE
jgi:hypothetical protein